MFGGWVVGFGMQGVGLEAQGIIPPEPGEVPEGSLASSLPGSARRYMVQGRAYGVCGLVSGVRG